MLTSRCRLLIPQSYKRLTAEVTTEVAQNLGANPIACSAMRNHVHLLCFVPTTISISEYIAKLREGLKEHILNNRHLRRIEDWSDESIVFTVSTYKISKEEIYVLDQDYIHSRSRLVNEMSPLYQRLNIPYVVSLH